MRKKADENMRAELERLQRERDEYLGKPSRAPRQLPPELSPERSFVLDGAAGRRDIFILQKTEDVEGTGGIVWNAGEALARWLYSSCEGVRSTAIVEVRYTTFALSSATRPVARRPSHPWHVAHTPSCVSSLLLALRYGSLAQVLVLYPQLLHC